MCEFCEKHGEGKKWYLNTKNYSHDLLSDLERQKFIHSFYHTIMGEGSKGLSKMEKIFKDGRKVPPFIVRRFSEHNKKVHYGQVLPIEDVRAIFEMSSSITRIACGCRWAADKTEERCCFGITLDPAKWVDGLDLDYFGRPDLAQHETMTLDQAMGEISRYDRQGLIHSVWTFMTPFIGGICNCDLEGCLAMRSTHGLGVPVMFRSEYVAEVDAAGCTGCRACEKLCPVRSIDHRPDEKKCAVNKAACYGCGVCRSACRKGAISLKSRSSDAVAAQVW